MRQYARKQHTIDAQSCLYIFKGLFTHLAVSGLSCCTQDLSRVTWDPSSWCSGFCSHGAWAPEHMGLAVAAYRLNCPVACGLLVSQSGVEPTFPAFESGFLTTGHQKGRCLYILM